jgi:hypothetical protein
MFNQVNSILLPYDVHELTAAITANIISCRLSGTVAAVDMVADMSQSNFLKPPTSLSGGNSLREKTVIALWEQFKKLESVTSEVHPLAESPR